LQAIGLRDELAHSSIRFGLGRGNTADEVDFVAAEVIENVRRLRALSPRYEMVLEGIDMKTIQRKVPAS
jgi:cysteine desulfurase